MKILLDECLDRRLARELPGHDVRTVPELGWAGKKNGELLRLADKEFDIFITVDQNIPAQQNIANFQLAFVVLKARSNRFEDLAPLLRDVFVQVAKGTVTIIGS